MWNRDKMWKCNENCIYGEIPMRERDGLQECNSFGNGDGIPKWNRDKCGNAMRIAFTMEFRRGKEIIARIAMKPKSMMKFRWERDKYSTPLNIQKSALNPQFWEEKMLVPNNCLCWQEQKLL